MSLGTSAASSVSVLLTVLPTVSPLDTLPTSSLPPALHVLPSTASRASAASAAAATRTEATDLTLSLSDVAAVLAPTAAAAASTPWVTAPLSSTDTYFAKKAAKQIKATGQTSLTLSAAAQAALPSFLSPLFVPATSRTVSAAALSDLAPPVVVVAATGSVAPMSDIAPAVALTSPSTGPPALSVQAQFYLTAFCGSDTVLQACATAKQSYLNTNRDLQIHKVQLEKFIAKCRRDGAPKVALPGNLRLNLVKNARLEAPKESPAFAKEALDALVALENATALSAFEILCAQKRKMIAHLEERATAASHIAHNKALCVKAIKDYAARVEKSVRPSTPGATGSLFTFPIGPAIEFVGQKLMTTINECVLAQIEADMKAEQKKVAAQAAQHIAQEEVLSGAHNGKTITKIAVREVEKRIAPIKRSVENLQDGRASASSPHTPPHFTPHARSSKPRSLSQTALGKSVVQPTASHAQRPSASVFAFAPELLALATPAPAGRNPENRKRKPSADPADGHDSALSRGRRSSHQGSNYRGGTPAVRTPSRAPSNRDDARSASPVNRMQE